MLGVTFGNKIAKNCRGTKWVPRDFSDLNYK